MPLVQARSGWVIPHAGKPGQITFDHRPKGHLAIHGSEPTAEGRGSAPRHVPGQRAEQPRQPARQDGRYQDGLAAAQEAVSLCRALAADNSAAHQENLARVLDNLGTRLGEVGPNQDALDARTESVDVWRQVASRNPDLYRARSAAGALRPGSDQGYPELVNTAPCTYPAPLLTCRSAPAPVGEGILCHGEGVTHRAGVHGDDVRLASSRDRSALVMRGARWEDGTVVATRPSSGWDRYAWVAGILFVVALVAETAVAFGVGVNQDDSAVKIATALNDHRGRLLVIAYLSVVYAAMFPIYLSRLHLLLREDPGRPRFLDSLVLAGGVLFVALHAVSDVGITGLFGAKLASFGFQHDPGVSYSLYLMTYALDSVGDVFGSLFAVAAGLLVIGSGVLPRWLGWVSILVGILFFLQGFGLGIATFGVVLDGIGFVLLLIFVLVSSVLLLRRESAVPSTSGRD